MSVPAAFFGVITIWATTPLAIKWSSEGAGFLFGVTSRMALGLLVCLVLTVALRRRMIWSRDALVAYLAAGLGVWGAMSGVYWSAQYLPSGLISVIFGLTPLVTGVMAAIWLDERTLTPRRLLGVMLGILGLAEIFANGRSIGEQAWIGVFGLLISVAIHSVSSVWVKRVGAGLTGLQTTTGALIVSVPLFLTSWYVFDGAPPRDLGLRAATSILYLAVFGSVFGFVMYYYLLRYVEAGRVALITLVTPVLALFVGHFVNAEPVDLRIWVGTSLILGGLAFYQWGDNWRWRLLLPSPVARQGGSEEQSRRNAG